MPNKWIPDPLFDGWDEDSNPEIHLTEIHGSRSESHNILSANPTFQVRLACKWEDLSRAVSELLGRPQVWPYRTVFNKAFSEGTDLTYAVAIQLVNDQGEAIKDAEGQTLDYQHNAIFDLTYMPRKGLYLNDYNDQDVYWDDEIQQRYSSFPMDNTKLIWSNLDGSLPAVEDRLPLHNNEAPVKFEVGETLVHTIEGWTIPVPSSGPIVGTTNDTLYFSPILKKEFAVGTLNLRSINIVKQYSFRSYRGNDPVIANPTIDPSGKPTDTLRLMYEYRKEGWAKYWRNNLDASLSGYYSIRKNGADFGIVDPFPTADHRVFLS